MAREDKKKIQRRAYWHDLLRQLRGTPDFSLNLFFLALYLVGSVYVATKQAALREQAKYIELISPILKVVMEHALTAYLLAGTAALLALLLYPFGSRATKDQLQCIGLVNHVGLPPDLLRKRRDKDNPRVTVSSICAVSGNGRLSKRSTFVWTLHPHASLKCFYEKPLNIKDAHKQMQEFLSKVDTEYVFAQLKKKPQTPKNWILLFFVMKTGNTKPARYCSLA